MSDAALEAALRAWRAEPTDPGLEEVVRLHKRAGVELPWDVLPALPRWRPLTELVDRWLAVPLREDLGNTIAELDAAEERLGVRLPAALRELYRLTGKRNDLIEWASYEDRGLEQIKLVDGRLVLRSRYTEPDLTIATTGLDDPPVRPVSLSLSYYAFAGARARLTRCIGLLKSNVVGAFTHETLTEDQLEALGEHFGAAVSVPAEEERIFCDASTVIRVDRWGAWLVARTEAAWKAVKGMLSLTWTRDLPRRYPVLSKVGSQSLSWLSTAGGPVLLLPAMHDQLWRGSSECEDGEEDDEDDEDQVYDYWDLIDGDHCQAGALFSLPKARQDTAWALVGSDVEGVHYQQAKDSLLLIQTHGAAEDLDILSVAGSETAWTAGVAEVRVPPGGLLLFDSAIDLRSFESGEILRIDLPAGRYVVDRLEHMSAVVDHAPGHAEPVSIEGVRIRLLVQPGGS